MIVGGADPPVETGGGIGPGTMWTIGSGIARGINRLAGVGDPITPAQRERFFAAGGTIAKDPNNPLGGKMGEVKFYMYNGVRQNFNQVRNIANNYRPPSSGPTNPRVDPNSSIPYVPPAPYIAMAAAPNVVIPPDEIARRRAARKALKAAKKVAGKARKAAKVAKPLLKYFPWLTRLRRYWGPTGQMLLARDLYHHRKQIKADYEAWEGKQPRVGATVIRAPGPGQIPRSVAYPLPYKRPAALPKKIPYSPSPGPLRRYVPPKKAPAANPWQPPAAAPRVSPVARPRTSGAPSPAAAPAPAARPAPLPAVWGSPGPAPVPVITFPKPAIPPWLKLAAPFVLPLLTGKPNKQPRVGTISDPVLQPNPFSGAQLQPLTLAQPFAQPQTDKCHCKKPKKKSGKPPCSNPVIRRRKGKTASGQPTITTTRVIQCQA
jgi:hypothetical protein